MAGAVVVGGVLLTVLVLAGLAPLATARPYTLALFLDRDRYSVGDTVDLVATASDGLRRVDVDASVTVFVLSSTRIYTAQRVDRGTYHLRFPVDPRDLVDYGGLLVVQVSATVRGFPVGAGAAATVTPGIHLQVRLSPRHPAVGGVVNVTATVLGGGGPMEADGVTMVVDTLSRPGPGVVLSIHRFSTGVYYGLFATAGSNPGDYFGVEVDGYAGPAYVAVADYFSIPGWSAWAHLVPGSWGTGVDVWVADASGQPAPGVAVNLRASEDGPWILQPANTTDAGGRAGFRLPLDGSGDLVVAGWLTAGTRRQSFGALLGSPHPWDHGLVVVPFGGDAFEGWVASGVPLVRSYLVLVDGRPLTSSRVLVSVRTTSTELLHAWFSTDRRGRLDLSFTPPRAPLGVWFHLELLGQTLVAFDGLRGMAANLRPSTPPVIPGALAPVTLNVSGAALDQALSPTNRAEVLLGPAEMFDQVWAWQPLTPFTGLELVNAAADGSVTVSMMVPAFMPRGQPYLLRATLGDQDVPFDGFVAATLVAS